MVEQNFSNVSKIIKILEGTGKCSECDQETELYNQELVVNHYLAKHGYSLLFIGTESGTPEGGQVGHFTVIIIGKPKN